MLVYLTNTKNARQKLDAAEYVRPTAALHLRETRTCPAFEEYVSCRKAPSRCLTLATSQKAAPLPVRKGIRRARNDKINIQK
jgi:hypothetical protein